MSGGPLGGGPLEGIRVVDLSRVFAMPYCGAYLADMGAEVIKVETHHSQFVDTTRTLNGPYPDNLPRADYWERGGTFHTLNRGKLSLTLDLRSDSALRLLRELVSVSDVLLENFTPHVTRRFGLDYATLRQDRPDLIMVSNTGYGHTGPWSDFGAMATALEPTHGTGAFTGYLDVDSQGRSLPGSIPNKIANSYTDFLASWSAQLAVLASLLHRARTGQGTWIDLAMYQNGVSFMGEGLLDFAFNGRRTRRIGNRHPAFSPHGCYPCLGTDQWVVLAVRDDAEWRGFCTAIGQAELATDPRFHDPIHRHRNQDDLDPIIADWTRRRTPLDTMEALQRAGVPAGPVLDARGLLNDPHLRDRRYFEETHHIPESNLGTREYVTRGWRLSNADVSIRGPAPTLGADNHRLLSGLLGLSDATIAELEDAEAVGSTLLGAGEPASVPLHRQVELGWTVDYDSDYRQRLPDDGAADDIGEGP